VRLVPEVEWDDDEQTLMLALALYEEQLCPSGHWLPESAAREAEGKYRGRTSLCHACAAVAVEVKRLKDHETPAALLFGAERERG
jgi:hypothetical protein